MIKYHTCNTNWTIHFDIAAMMSGSTQAICMRPLSFTHLVLYSSYVGWNVELFEFIPITIIGLVFRFHQRSSCQLKSVFSHCGECTSTSDFDKQISTSPKLPSSVSRSRGKHYRSKRWRLDNCESLLNKQHPVKVLSGKSSCLDSQFGEEIQPKLSFRNLRGTLRSESSLVCESIHTGNAIRSCSKPVSTFGDPASRSSSMGNKASGSSTRSTITSQSTNQQKQNYREVPTQPSGPGTLRKSCITGQASRLDMNNERKLSKGYKSSTGKSSVGSSSSLLYDAKSSTSSLIHHKETNTVSRNVARMTYAAKNKAQTSSVSNASTTKIAGSSNARMRTKVSFVKSAQQEAAKPKVRRRTNHIE